LPKVGPRSLQHSIAASGFEVIFIGSFPEGLISVNRKDWLSGIALEDTPMKENITKEVKLYRFHISSTKTSIQATRVVTLSAGELGTISKNSSRGITLE